MTESEQTAALSTLAFTDLWDVAGRLAARLEKLAITAPLQLRDADPQLVRQQLGVFGERLVLELRGIPLSAPFPKPSRQQKHRGVAIVRQGRDGEV